MRTLALDTVKQALVVLLSCLQQKPKKQTLENLAKKS